MILSQCLTGRGKYRTDLYRQRTGNLPQQVGIMVRDRPDQVHGTALTGICKDIAAEKGFKPCGDQPMEIGVVEVLMK